MTQLPSDVSVTAVLDAPLEAAIDWMVVMTSGQVDEHRRNAFSHWLQSDPQHPAAWRRIENVLSAPVEQLRRAGEGNLMSTALVQQITALQPASSGGDRVHRIKTFRQ